MRPTYPFAAVVGQAQLKRALLLCAIDPAIGGVLVEGPRGVAKTTLARALAELVPGSFVELPLGASEERVTGSLDLQSALRDGEVTFAPGLLARAHEGVLYVDEINLLPDALVDLLLDSAASGHNVVERDGISHSHPARFVLVGTMNPDEGELRPQLTDRFGLAARAEPELTLEERTEIVRRRLAFDADPGAFAARFAEEQRSLGQRCAAARERVQQIELSNAAISMVSERCQREQLEGVRADLAMLRAARAHAAFYERSQIAEEDVEAVAELALMHRRSKRSEPPRSGPQGGGGASRGSSNLPSSANTGGRFGSAGASQGAPPAESSEEDAALGALAPVAVQAAALPRLPASLLRPRGRSDEARRAGTARRASGRGRRGHSDPRGRSIDWFATLARARRPALEDLCYRARRAPSAELLVVALDCSSSMLKSGALARAKAVVQACEADAARAGARVALVSFRGGDALLELDSRENRTTRRRVIGELTGGGGTPLRGALEAALDLCAKRPSAGKRIVLLTDARSREQVADLAGRVGDVELLVVDCESGPIRLGRAAVLARALGGDVLHLDQLAP